MNVYLVTVNPSNGDSADADNLIAYAYGSFKTVNFATREALASIKGTEGEYALRVTEVAAVGDADAKRTVVSVTGEADVVTFIAKKKLAAERKAQGGAGGDDDTEAEADAPAE